MIRKSLIFMLACALSFLSAGSAMAAPKDKDLSQGREQLVAAFDAAFTRVVNSGAYRCLPRPFIRLRRDDDFADDFPVLDDTQRFAGFGQGIGSGNRHLHAAIGDHRQ